jgi:DNA repair protein RAD50
MQLIQKASKQEYKTIDGALQTLNDKGELVSQGYKCGDLDKEVPELMGVSKAILRNVIFCHQEEANWPLDESKSVKKRFDEIFASTRYTKALEEITEQKKNPLERTPRT